AAAIGLGREARRRGADRDQLGVGGAGRRGGLGRRGLRGRRFGRGGRGGGRGVAAALLLGGLGGGLLGRQLARGFLLRALLLRGAFALELRLALGFLFLPGFGRGGAGHRLLAPGRDRLLQARQCRCVRVGLLHQREQPLGLVEVVAADALLGGDERVGHQVGQRACHGRIGGLLVAQRQVVLHRVVARGRVQALLAQRGAGGLAQCVGVHRRHFGGDGLGGDRGFGGGIGRAGGIGRRILGGILGAGPQRERQRKGGGGRRGGVERADGSRSRRPPGIGL